MSTMYVKYLSAVVVWLHTCASVTPVTSDMQYVKMKSGDIAFPDELDAKNISPHSYHMHHHHYHPDFRNFHQHEEHHNHNFKDATTIRGDETRRNTDDQKPPGPYRSEDAEQHFKNASTQIPLEFIQDINKYSINDLLLNFVEGGSADSTVLEDRFGGEEDERNAAVTPKEAGCIPELQTVKIVTSDDPSVLYIPQCTRVERCGGCCSHTLLACQPQESEYINYKVIKTQYNGGKKLKFVAKEVVLVEKHTKCKCDCRVRAEDCNRYQEYRKSECRCACMNYDEEKKCNKENVKKLWNPDLCVCQCRDTMECSTGSYFDTNECRCVTSPTKRRFATFERKSGRSEPLPVKPLEDYY